MALREAWGAFLFAPGVLIMWLALWSNLNSGYWNVRDFLANPASVDLPTLLRAAVPYLGLPAILFLLASHWRRVHPFLEHGASRDLVIYGVIALAASVLSPAPLAAFYFGLAFLATVYCSLIFARPLPDGTPLARPFMLINWAVAAFFAAAIIYTARDLVLADDVESAYAIITSVDEKTRSSGAARFCAVPMIIALSRFIAGRGVWRWVWVPVFVFFFQLIFKLESRGAIFGILFATVFIWFIGRGLAKSLFVFVLLAFAFTILDPDMTALDTAREHIRRGQSDEEFRTLTGRTGDWETALEMMRDSPVIEQLVGYGNWADRAIIERHVHNTFIQALMIAGLIGFLFFCASWVKTWVNFWRIYQHREWLPPPDRHMLIEAGAVFAFFTVRSIPETTNASFSVDLLVMAPIMVYFDHLAVRIRQGTAPVPVEEPDMETEPLMEGEAEGEPVALEGRHWRGELHETECDK